MAGVAKGSAGKAGAGNGQGKVRREAVSAKLPARASPDDDLNQKIIRLLQQDGRLPYDVIAAELKVSAGTVRNRVNRMRDAGQISIVAVVDPVATGYAADAMLGIKVAPTATPKSVADRLGPFPEVVYILWVSGRYDLLVELVCDAETAFTEFLERHLYGQPDIAQLEVMTGIDMFKNQFLLKRHVGEG